MNEVQRDIFLRRLDRNSALDARDLQAIIDATPSYWRLISGQASNPDGAKATLEALPPGKSHADKYVLLGRQGNKNVGCVDLVRAFPDAETVMLGLLTISELHQKRGLGHALYRSIEELLRSWEGVRKIRIGVVSVNHPGLAFWARQGFREQGPRRPYRENEIVAETIVMEKELSRS